MLIVTVVLVFLHAVQLLKLRVYVNHILLTCQDRKGSLLHFRKSRTAPKGRVSSRGQWLLLVTRLPCLLYYSIILQMKVEIDLFGQPVVDVLQIKKIQYTPNPVRQPPKHNRSYRFIDLFCGGGAFHLAFSQQNRGHSCALACDIHRPVITIYQHNFLQTPFHNDVTTLHSLPQHDLICGGFPCQAFSNLGKREGMTVPKGTLIFEIIRLAKLQPTPCLILENVVPLLTIDNSRAFATILHSLYKAGYVVYTKVLSACHHANVPQNRFRVFLVCFHKDIDSSSFRFPAAVPLTVTVKDLMMPHSEVPYKHYYFSKRKPPYYDRFLSQVPKSDHFYKKKIEKSKKHKYNVDIPAHNLVPTICRYTWPYGYSLSDCYFCKTPDGHLRTMTLVEVMRYMGFPADYKWPPMKESNYYNMLGNSIVVPVLYRLIQNVTYTLDSN